MESLLLHLGLQDIIESFDVRVHLSKLWFNRIGRGNQIFTVVHKVVKHSNLLYLWPFRELLSADYPTSELLFELFSDLHCLSN